MGFLEPHYFSFHSSDISTRHQLLAITVVSNRLILIALLAVALLPVTVLTVEPLLLQQPSEQHDADNQLSSCETKALDDVPPDPVSTVFLLAAAVHANDFVSCLREKHVMVGICVRSLI
jgi:hypothetical protein